MTNIAKNGMQKRKPRVLTTGSGLNTKVRMRFDGLPLYQISQRTVVTESFYARFLAYFTSDGEGTDIRNRRTWLHSLPVLTTDGTNEALVLAVQATASVYCAVESNNLALTQYSRKLYGEALRKHYQFVSRSQNKYEVTVHMVSTSVLFSFFEAIQATNAEAYRSHIYGAVRMLEVTKPKQCSGGALCQIFYHIRTQMVFINLTKDGKETPFQVQRILYGSLEYIRLPVFQRLMSHVSYLVEENAARESGASQQPISPKTYTEVATNIEELWLEYVGKAASNGTSVFWQDVKTGAMQFRDEFTALTVAYFSAARILLCIVASQYTNSLSTMPHQHSIILQASRYLQTYTNGFAYMRMATPLLLVALHSPASSQREKATACFEHWINGPMSGISALALERIQRHLAPEKQLTDEAGSAE
ncbi:hypothetical protein AG0111_0g7620 [Alternaria gaisen]|uniref:Uncharacterized protein n=1 Tax=Alternaria gaisen TaxID=167740 RepID=A0ACB6FIC2_9PLEO|nr:hypothetical protein AG0111_0g7620 [Alternaria gaisen]